MTFGQWVGNRQVIVSQSTFYPLGKIWKQFIPKAEKKRMKKVSSSNSLIKNISKRKKNEHVVCDNYREEIWNEKLLALHYTVAFSTAVSEVWEM